jgi:hypothetical protein
VIQNPTVTDTAEDQARAQFESIAAMVARLEHAQECSTPDDCPLTAQDIADGLGEYRGTAPVYGDDGAHALIYEWNLKPGDREDYHDADEAEQRIHEDPLSVQVREGWHSPGENLPPAEFEILLCTGGPAVRMRGTLLDPDSQPDKPRLEYQDWGTPWTEYRPHFDPDPETISDRLNAYRETLLGYARQFYFGE